MAHIIEDRVLEASTSVGTGTFTLAGAVAGYRAFSAVCSVSDTVPYYIEAVDANGIPTGAYEYGKGTYSSASVLTRTTVRGSSNAGAAVSFAAGSKLVGIGIPAPVATSTKSEWRTSISAVGLTDINVFTKNQSIPAVSLTPGATVAVDASLSNSFKLTAAQNFTLSNPTNLTESMVLQFRIKQDGTGSRVVTWGSKYKFPSATAGVLATAAGARNLLTCYYDITDDVLECVLSGGTGFG